MKFLAIRRDDRFSPNAVEKDKSILRRCCEVVRRSLQLKEDIRMVDEREFARNPIEADVYLSMARLRSPLHMLCKMETAGAWILNAPRGVLNCIRSLLDRIMRVHQISMPPAVWNYGYWLKRGDEAAQSKADVVFCKDTDALVQAKEAFRARGVKDMVVSAHVPGDLLKFYGVGAEFFRFFYPSDDGISKFGDEKLNGKAHHYSFDSKALQSEVVKLSKLVGVDVFGGDAIVDSQGRYYIIDFNDWPSFSRCREDAAVAIAAKVVHHKAL